MIGFDFTKGGNAVIRFEFPEVQRFLEALIEIEKRARKPSAEIVDAFAKAAKLNANRYYGKSRSPNYRIEAIVPIAQLGARIQPVFPEVPVATTEHRTKQKAAVAV